MRCLIIFALLVSTAGAQHGYLAADGKFVRRPHHYKRHPNTGTDWTAICKDGSYSFAHSHSGVCSRHGGVKIWK